MENIIFYYDETEKNVKFNTWQEKQRLFKKKVSKNL